MTPTPECPDDARLSDFSAGLLDCIAYKQVAEHLSGCLRCRKQVFACEPTIEDDGPEGFRFDTTGSTLDEGEKTHPATAYDAELNKEQDDSAIRFLFPNRDGDRLGWLGGYEVCYELGRGGMGIVFKGVDHVLHRVIAIKVMNPALAVNERSRIRFAREGRAMAAINHPNVVAVYAVDEYKDVPFLVMEYVPGEGLDQRIRRQAPLSCLEVMRIGAQIADGLEAAHAQGTIHRDVKPANVMLECSVDRVKISDFGLARATLDEAELTPTDQVLGTPSYMSPEQIQGKAVDARADIFSLGCVLHAMVAGRSPFTGSHVVDVVRRVCDETPTRLDQIDPNVPAPLADLVSRLLAKDPADRIQTAAEVAAELRRYLSIEDFSDSRKIVPLLSQPKKRRNWYGPSKLGTFGWLLGVVAMALAIAVLRPRVVPSPARPAQLQPPPRSSEPLQLTVSDREPAHFARLADAVSYATPGSTIRILDDGTYEGPIWITDQRRSRDLTIESPLGATLSAPEAEIAALVIKNTPGVTVRGLRIVCSSVTQHGVVFYYDVTGASLENVQIEQPKDSRASAVYATAGTHGSPENPLRLSGLDLSAGLLGIALIGEKSGFSVSSVQIEHCRIQGEGNLIILEHSVQDVTVIDNILTGGEIGLNLSLTDATRPTNIVVHNNTFYGCNAWAGLGDTDAQLKGIALTRNLVVNCRSVYPTSHDLAVVGPLWFQKNVWSKNGPEVGYVARSVDEVPLVSTDPASPDYLRPADPASVSLKDEATGTLSYAGALAPRSTQPKP